MRKALLKTFTFLIESGFTQATKWIHPVSDTGVALHHRIVQKDIRSRALVWHSHSMLQFRPYKDNFIIRSIRLLCKLALRDSEGKEFHLSVTLQLENNCVVPNEFDSVR